MGYRTTKSKIKAESNKVNNYTEFYYHTFRNILIVSIPLLVVSGIVLSHLSLHSSATGSGTDQIQFSLSTSCTMSSVVDEAHTKAISNGTYHSDVGKTTITTLCNDGNGYSVYANGYSNNEEGNTKLINAEHPEFSIDTGLATSGLISNWAMKLNNIPDDPSPTPPVIEPAYDNTYGLVPQYWTRVASRPSGTTDMDEGSSFTTTYAIYTTSNQHTGTYNGQVKYLLTHPSYEKPPYYMQDIAYWKDELILEESVQAIDKRDGKSYWVTKLKDGNIWMTQNLDFDLIVYANEQGKEVMRPLTSENTDLTDHSLAEAYADGYSYDVNTGITTWTPAISAKTIEFQNTGPITGWQYSTTAPYSANKTDSTETGHASLGNYYNWTAAIASNNSLSLTQNTLNNMANNPKNSICPKGWRLPTISGQPESETDSTNEFARLNYLYNNNSTSSGIKLMSNPVYFTLSGSITRSPSGFNELEDKGFYYSSTNYNSTNSYLIEIRQDFVGPSAGATYYNGREAGRSVRCVAR